MHKAIRCIGIAFANNLSVHVVRPESFTDVYICRLRHTHTEFAVRAHPAHCKHFLRTQPQQHQKHMSIVNRNACRGSVDYFTLKYEPQQILSFGIPREPHSPSKYRKRRKYFKKCFVLFLAAACVRRIPFHAATVGAAHTSKVETPSLGSRITIQLNPSI